MIFPVSDVACFSVVWTPTLLFDCVSPFSYRWSLLTPSSSFFSSSFASTSLSYTLVATHGVNCIAWCWVCPVAPAALQLMWLTLSSHNTQHWHPLTLLLFQPSLGHPASWSPRVARLKSEVQIRHTKVMQKQAGEEILDSSVKKPTLTVHYPPSSSLPYLIPLILQFSYYSCSYYLSPFSPQGLAIRLSFDGVGVPFNFGLKLCALCKFVKTIISYNSLCSSETAHEVWMYHSVYTSGFEVGLQPMTIFTRLLLFQLIN